MHLLSLLFISIILSIIYVRRSNGKWLSQRIFKSAMLSYAVSFSITSPSFAIDPQEAFVAKVYDNAAKSYDKLDGGELPEKLGYNSFREKLGSRVKGNGLEVGVGTGIQLPYYHWNQIEKYIGIDISKNMLAKAEEKMKELRSKGVISSAAKIEFISASASAVPLTDSQVSSFQ